jgi:hypothetical protein
MQNKAVQFNENHKWCGCFGIVTESRPDIDRYMVGVPIPQQGTAYIFAKLAEIEVIGDAVLTFKESEDE